MIYIAEWEESDQFECLINADSEEEALAKLKRGEIIEGSQDSDPGDGAMKKIRISPKE